MLDCTVVSGLLPGLTVGMDGGGDEANKLPFGPEPKLAYFMTRGFLWGS